MIKKCLFALIVISVVSQSFAEEKKTFMPHNIGAGAGFVTGYGLSYRHWFNNGHGFQLNVAPYYSKSDDTEQARVSLGLTGLKVVKEANVVNFFLYYGAHIFYSYYNNIATDVNYNYEAMDDNKYYMGFAGAGPGLDIHFWRISLNFMCGLAAHVSDDNNYGVQMTGEMAVFYTF